MKASSLILKCSLAGAVALAVASGCGDNKDDETPSGEAGEGNSGGSSAGSKNDGGSKSDAGSTSDAGEPSNGGSESVGGAGPDAGGAANAGSGGSDLFGGAPGTGGAAGTPYEGPPVAKFCNTLYFGDDPTTFRLEVGTGNDKVTFTAASGECVPADGNACTEIPSGEAVTVALFDVDADTDPVDFADIAISENTQYLFVTDTDTVVVDQMEEIVPIWSGGSLKAEFACEDVTYDSL